MDVALYLSLVGFVIVMSVTPGPNNLMLMSSSALFGVRATLPTWLGVNIGFNIMLVAAVFGLGTLVARFPMVVMLVKFGGAIWLAWMAWLFLRAGLAKPGAQGQAAAPSRSRACVNSLCTHSARRGCPLQFITMLRAAKAIPEP